MSNAQKVSDADLVDQLRRLVDDQEGGDAVVLVQRQLFNRVVGRLAARAAPTSDAHSEVGVKALPWYHDEKHPDSIFALQNFGPKYEVKQFNGGHTWGLSIDFSPFIDYPDQASAVAAAQSDFSERVISTFLVARAALASKPEGERQ